MVALFCQRACRTVGNKGNSKQHKQGPPAGQARCKGRTPKTCDPERYRKSKSKKTIQRWNPHTRRYQESRRNRAGKAAGTESCQRNPPKRRVIDKLKKCCK